MSENTTTDTATESDATEVDESAETQTESTTETGDESALGDAGKRALDAMKQRVKDAETARKAEKARADALEAAAALRDKPAEEQAIETAKAEARTEALKAANDRILRSELRAAATGKLADPTDAALYINLSDFTVTDDGEVDSDALNEAISELIEKKPHLAAPKANRFDGNADQGAKGKEAGPQQLGQADLDRMVAANDHDGIAQARAEGRFNKLLGIK